MRTSRSASFWYLIGASALGVFVVAIVVLVTLEVTAGDSPQADQLASVVSMIVGIASLTVGVVGLVQGRRESTAPAVDPPERVFADELRAFLDQFGLSVRELEDELRRNVSEHSPYFRQTVGEVLRGERRPTREVVAVIAQVVAARAPRDRVPPPDGFADERRWQERCDELFGTRRPQRRRVVVIVGMTLVGIVVLPVTFVLSEEDGPTPGVRTENSGHTALGGGATGDPITTSSEERPNVCTGGWLLPRAPSEVAPPPVGQDRQKWVDWGRGAGLPHANVGRVEFTVQGTSNATVILTRVRVTAVRRPAPRGGAWLRLGCGGDTTFRWFHVSLDIEPPRVNTDYDLSQADHDGPPMRREPIRFPYRVSLEDPESFEVHATTRTCDCLWQIELDWTSGGRRGTHVVGNDGRPVQFRTVGIAGAETGCVDALDKCRPLDI